MKKAILVVSFGTTVDETREKTIGEIENDVRTFFPDYDVVRAFTSSIVMDRMRKNGLEIDDTAQALEKLASAGYEQVFVQPTHIVAGEEYDKVVTIAKDYSGKFNSLKIGKPLLSDDIDYRMVKYFLLSEFSLVTNEALVLMGHGTSHSANASYEKLATMLEEQNMFLGTVEATPTLEDVMAKVKNFKKIRLAPFMIVAGDHAINDMDGEEETSWKKQLENAGYSVNVVLKGLGEYSEIRAIYCNHIRSEI